MKTTLFALLLFVLFTVRGPAQNASEPSSKPQPAPDTSQHAAQANEVQQLRLDVQRLQSLVNQMRTNLAFVQTSQTPLKHQFEIEADAWQIVIDDMNRRIQRMEQDHGQDRTPQKKLP